MTRVVSIAVACLAIGVACSKNPPAPDVRPRAGDVLPGAAATPGDAGGPETANAAGSDADAVDAGPDDPMALHLDTQADLLKLVWLPEEPDGRSTARRDATLAYLIAPAPGHFNDGNRALAHHSIGQRACLAGLGGVTIQTDEQRAICGAPNMVPIYTNGDPRSAKACIDVFEFPNRVCELPFVWGSPSEAETMCRIEGKRLCADKEWNLACGGDPTGKKKWPYAYGERLDLSVCHTNVPKEMNPDGKTWACNPRDASSTWATCSTDSEPSGAFPKCRSRMGVYDQHGNLAEEMSRAEGDEVFTQLKGSAWFYVDVGREVGKPPWHPERESYPDNCTYDPRWHVEHLKEALHVNYHLGFRCCKDVHSGE